MARSHDRQLRRTKLGSARGYYWIRGRLLDAKGLGEGRGANTRITTSRQKTKEKSFNLKQKTAEKPAVLGG